MSASLNKVMLIGNVGKKDPEVRYLDQNSQSGNKVANFTLATTERYKDRGGNQQERTEWHNIVAWGKNADFAEKYIHRGASLYVEGRLRTSEYTDANGVKKYRTEVYVERLQLLGSRNDGDQPAGQAPQRSNYQQGGSNRQGGQAPYQAPSDPSYQAPSTPAPSYQAPSDPSYQAPSTPAPSYQAPAAPTYQAPSAPSYQAPSAPAYQAPSTPAPSYQAPQPSPEAAPVDDKPDDDLPF